MHLTEASKAVEATQHVEVFVSRRRPAGVAAERGRIDVQLLGQEPDDSQRHGLARTDHATGVAQRAELQGKAEPVVLAAPPRDVGVVVEIERVVADQVGLFSRKRK